MRELFAFIQHRFGFNALENKAGCESLRIQSISLGDNLLYADFLSDADAMLDSPLLSIVKKTMIDGYVEEGDEEHRNERMDVFDTALASSEVDSEDYEGKRSVKVDNDAIAECHDLEDFEGENLEAISIEGEEEQTVEDEDVAGNEDVDHVGNISKPNANKEESMTEELEEKIKTKEDKHREAALDVYHQLQRLSFLDFEVVCARCSDSEEVDVKLPPVRVRLIRQPPLAAREVLSSLFDAEMARKHSLISTSIANRSRQAVVNEKTANLIQLAKLISFYLLQYVIIQAILILTFGEAYVRGKKIVDW